MTGSDDSGGSSAPRYPLRVGDPRRRARGDTGGGRGDRRRCARRRGRPSGRPRRRRRRRSRPRLRRRAGRRRLTAPRRPRPARARDRRRLRHRRVRRALERGASPHGGWSAARSWPRALPPPCPERRAAGGGPRGRRAAAASPAREGIGPAGWHPRLAVGARRPGDSPRAPCPAHPPGGHPSEHRAGHLRRRRGAALSGARPRARGARAGARRGRRIRGRGRPPPAARHGAARAHRADRARARWTSGDVPAARRALLQVAWSGAMAATLELIAERVRASGGADRVAKALADFDFASLRRLERTRVLVRAGPALGPHGHADPARAGARRAGRGRRRRAVAQPAGGLQRDRARAASWARSPSRSRWSATACTGRTCPISSSSSPPWRRRRERHARDARGHGCTAIAAATRSTAWSTSSTSAWCSPSRSCSPPCPR